MRNFLTQMDKPKEEKVKLYKEADEFDFEVPTFEEPVNDDPELDIGGEDSTKTTPDTPEVDDNPELDVDGDGDEDPESEWDFDNQDNNEDASGIESDNMFEEGEDENTPDFRRKVRRLNEVYAQLYDQYRDVIDKLREIDVTGHKATVLNILAQEYEEILKSLSDYSNDNNDTWVIRFETFVKFRAAFIALNKRLTDAQNEANVLN